VSFEKTHVYVYVCVRVCVRSALNRERSAELDRRVAEVKAQEDRANADIEQRARQQQLCRMWNAAMPECLNPALRTMPCPMHAVPHACRSQRVRKVGLGPETGVSTPSPLHVGVWCAAGRRQRQPRPQWRRQSPGEAWSRRAWERPRLRAGGVMGCTAWVSMGADMGVAKRGRVARGTGRGRGSEQVVPWCVNRFDLFDKTWMVSLRVPRFSRIRTFLPFLGAASRVRSRARQTTGCKACLAFETLCTASL
jgi:hypothetical protein